MRWWLSNMLLHLSIFICYSFYHCIPATRYLVRCHRKCWQQVLCPEISAVAGNDRLECSTRGFRVTDTRGAVLFSADKNEVVVGAEVLKVTGMPFILCSDDFSAIYKSVQPCIKFFICVLVSLSCPSLQKEASAGESLIICLYKRRF